MRTVGIAASDCDQRVRRRANNDDGAAPSSRSSAGGSGNGGSAATIVPANDARSDATARARSSSFASARASASASPATADGELVRHQVLEPEEQDDRVRRSGERGTGIEARLEELPVRREGDLRRKRPCEQRVRHERHQRIQGERPREAEAERRRDAALRQPLLVRPRARLHLQPEGGVVEARQPRRVRLRHP